MTNASTATMPNGSRVSIDALGAIVDGHAQELSEIRRQITGLGDRMGLAIESLSNKIDAQQQAAFNQQQAMIAAGKGNWVGVIAAIGTVAGVFVSAFVVIGSMAISPIREATIENKADIRETEKTAVKMVAFNEWASEQQKRNLWQADQLDKIRAGYVAMPEFDQFVRRIDDRSAEHQAANTKAFDMVADELKTVRAQLVPRDEHTARWSEFDNRLNALSIRLNEMQHEFGSNFTLGDAVKGIEARLDRLQSMGQHLAPPASP